MRASHAFLFVYIQYDHDTDETLNNYAYRLVTFESCFLANFKTK